MFKTILVPIDLAQESSWRFALPEALELARGGPAKIVVFTLIPN